MKMRGSITVALAVGLAGAGHAAPQAQDAGQDKEEAKGHQQTTQTKRNFSAAAIEVPSGYRVEPVVTGLNYPVDTTFSDDGTMYVAETGGHTYGTKPAKAPPARLLKVLPSGETEVVYDHQVPLEEIRKVESSEAMPEGIIPPITGLTWHDGLLYVTHRTRVSTLDPETGEFKTIINGMPSWGEFFNHKVVFGPDDRMYFVLSSQGNSGPVDSHMMEVMNIFGKPNAHEVPCEQVTLTGVDYTMDNKLTEEKGDKIVVGTYVPPGQETKPGQVVEGQFWCNGALYSAKADGSDLKRRAWGLRSNFGYDFHPDGSLYVTQNSGNIMEPRPIYNDWEPIYKIEEGAWYGWPDYYSSVPVTDPRFAAPIGQEEVPGDAPKVKPEEIPFDHAFALTEETRKHLLKGRESPIDPVVKLPVHSAAEGMVFGNEAFGVPENEMLVAEFGAIISYYADPEEWPGFRVQRVNPQTGEITDFLVNKSDKPASATQEGGLERPIQVTWGPNNALYVTDFGIIHFKGEEMNAVPHTGVIWKAVKTDTAAKEWP